MLNTSFFLFVAFLAPLADLWLYPWLQRTTAPGARIRYHLIGAASLWLMAGIAVALVLRHPQPWSDLRLDVPSPLRLAAGLALVIAYIAFVMKQRRALLGKPERLRGLLQKHASTVALAPHTPAEVKSFAVLSVSAGVCEEIVYRGFMLWFVAIWIGLWPAVLATSVLFGIAHGYLGRKYVVRTALGGVLFGVIVVGSASLWPAIVLHAFTDLFSGDLFYRALKT